MRGAMRGPKLILALSTIGVGKSFIINTLVMNSSVDEATYKTDKPSNYVPEALLDLCSSSNERPSFHKLLTDADTGRDDVTVTLLQPDGDFTAKAQAAKQEYGKMEDSVKRFCEIGGDKPQIERYVLPSGECVSTTAVHTRVRYGQVVHLLVEYYSEDDLKKDAFTVHSAPRTRGPHAHARCDHLLVLTHSIRILPALSSCS